MIFTPGSPPPLLSYGLEADPEPVRADAPFVLTLIVSNAGDDPVTCTSISLTLPVGTDATDMIDGGTTTEVRPASGWTSTVSGGVVTLTPPDGSVVIEGDGLVFTISNAANAEPGTATLAIEETASTDGAQQQASGSFTVDKFPADFSLGDLTPIPSDKLDYAYGETASLTWVATGSAVSCTLDYQPTSSGDPVSDPVPDVPAGGRYQTRALTRPGSVTFTLSAEITVLGQDDPLVANRQLTVSVESLSVQAVVYPPRVGMYGLVMLGWEALNADHCLLEDGTKLAASGQLYFLVTGDRTFTVTAVAADGHQREVQAMVTVDPSIQPTEAGHVVTGADGEPGTPGHVSGLGLLATPGGPGGNGADADLTVALAPLDTTGGSSLVIPITVTGGAGGRGGEGGNLMAAGGAGGNGGDATLTATFDESLSPPAQYIIHVTGGAPGLWGLPGGAPGTAGTATATIAGQILDLP